MRANSPLTFPSLWLSAHSILPLMNLLDSLPRKACWLIAASLSLSASSGLSQTFTSMDTPLPIPDQGTAVSIITVPSGTGTIGDLNVEFTGSHSFVRDLTLTVTSPQGTSVHLIARPFTPAPIGSDLNGTYTFDDDAAPRVADFGALPVIPVGSYHPTTVNDALSFLSNVNGETADGVWTLSIQDSENLDTGTLNAWSLVVTPVVTPVQDSARPAQADLQIGKTAAKLRGAGIRDNRKAKPHQTISYSQRIFTNNRSTAHLAIANPGDTAAKLRLRSSGDQFPRMTATVRSEGRNVSAAFKAGRFAPLVGGGSSVRVVYQLKTDRFYAGVLRGGDRNDVVRFRLTGAGTDHAALENRYRH